MAVSGGLPSRRKKPPGIFPAAYIRSSTSIVSGKKSIPSRGFERTQVASTWVCPYVTTTLPSASFASLPASNVISCAPTWRDIVVTIRSISSSESGRAACAPLGGGGFGPVVSGEPPGRHRCGSSRLRTDLASGLPSCGHSGGRYASLLRAGAAAAALMILLVQLEMLGEVADPLGQYGDLHLGGAGVARGAGMLLDDLGLGFFGQRHRRRSRLPATTA